MSERILLINRNTTQDASGKGPLRSTTLYKLTTDKGLKYPPKGVRQTPQVYLDFSGRKNNAGKGWR